MRSIDDYKEEFDTIDKLAKIKIIVISLATILIIGAGVFTACGNKNVFDFTYSYNYAYIKLQNGEVIEGSVSSWTDYEDGDQLQITIDGVTYLVHASNCTLVYYGEQK